MKDQLTCKPANPLPAVSGTSTPAATDVAMEAASDTEGSELSFQVDPRKTVSEPPLSPKSIIGATPEDARPSLPAEGTGEPEGIPNAGTSLPAGGTEEPEGIPNAGTSLRGGGTEEPAAPSPTGGTAATPEMNGSWQLENAHLQGPDDLSDLDTVKSFEIIDENDL